MIRLWVRILIFFLPALYIFGTTVLALILSGEITPKESILAVHKSSSTSMLASEFYDWKYWLKYLSINERRPEILALGSARVVTIRSNVFKNPEKFYNAGSAVLGVDQLKPILGKIESRDWPKLILVGLDQQFFYPSDRKIASRSDLGPEYTGSLEPKNYFGWENNFAESYATLNGLLKRRGLRASELLSKRINSSITVLGARAILDGNGFLNDGSYHYGTTGDQITYPTFWEDYSTNFSLTRKRINDKNAGFFPGRAIHPDAKEILDDFLNLAQSHGTHVVASIPPFAPKIFQIVYREQRQNYQYMANLKTELLPLFRKHNFSLFDLADISNLGATDAEFLDGFHASEKAMLRAVIFMIDHDVLLKSVTRSSDDLKDALLKSTSNFQVFPIEQLGLNSN